eukprot:TRINITY_DN1540_c0_g1_i4.p1 TRINITY_DN1540_c0_g1~~TRINITY_DN1540_c0_g1_i4.p1  ORF type:complete len:371 (+),score=33.55 TRINITY_DN1540_c0_g1_i4:103-1215(+)
MKTKLMVMYKMLCKRSKILAKEMNIRDISGCLWALAKFKWKIRNQTNIFVEQIFRVTQEKNYQANKITLILWSFSNLQCNNIKIIKHLVNLMKERIFDLTPLEIANGLYALYTLKYYDKQLIQLIEQFILSEQFDNARGQTINNIIIAFLDFELENKEKVLAKLVNLFLNYEKQNTQELINFIYAISILNCPINQTQLVVNKLIEQNAENDNYKFSSAGLGQLRRAYIEYASRNQTLIFPEKLQEQAKISLQNYVKDSIKENQNNVFFDDVRQKLSTQFQISGNALIFEDCEFVQAIEIQGLGGNQKVAVFPIKSTLFWINRPNVMLGRTKYMMRLVERLGWKTIAVDKHSWKNEQYRQNILNTIGESLQ